MSGSLGKFTVNELEQDSVPGGGLVTVRMKLVAEEGSPAIEIEAKHVEDTGAQVGDSVSVTFSIGR